MFTSHLMIVSPMRMKPSLQARLMVEPTVLSPLVTRLPCTGGSGTSHLVSGVSMSIQYRRELDSDMSPDNLT